MHHPFEGIILPQSREAGAAGKASLADHRPEFAAEPATASRRGFLARTLGVATGALAFGASRASTAQEGQRGAENPPAGQGRPSDARPETQHHDGGGPVTTQALGEEGGRGQVTTFALGEEGSGYPGGWRSAPPPGQYTTFALGEEGGPYYPGPRYRYPRYYDPMPLRRRYPPAQRYTTQALGEEGGWWQ